jgi:hypothetical protein
VGRTLRVETQAPKGSLVHVYRNGELVKSVTPEEAKALTIPAAGATAEDVQIVVVTRSGEVLSTPEVAAPTESAPSDTAGGAATTPTGTSTPAVTPKSTIGKPATGKTATGKTAAKSATGKTPVKTGQRQASDKNK